MYTTHCDDPDCVKCRHRRRTSEVTSEVVMMATGRQAAMPLAPSVEEENRNKILRTLEESMSKDLLEAIKENESYVKSCDKVKDEIHNCIGRLIEVLRERERDLCRELEQTCRYEMERIHHQASLKCFGNKLNKSLTERPPSKPVFRCEFDFILSELEKFGQLSLDTEDSLWDSLYTEESHLKQLLVDEVTPSTLLLDTPFESATTPINIDNSEKVFKGLREKLHCLESLVSLRDVDALKRLRDLETMKTINKMKKCARKTKNLMPLRNEDGLEKLHDLEILNDLQKCARESEKMKALAKARNDKVHQLEECLDSVQRKEFEKDNSSVTIVKRLNEDNFRYRNSLSKPIQANKLSENLSKISKDDGQPFEEATDVLSCKEVGKDISKLKEEETWRSIKDIDEQLKMKIDCWTKTLDLNCEPLKKEKWEDLESTKKELQHLAEMMGSACSAELGKYDASDEDDMEIISRSEAASIPLEMPALPPKNRFRFGRKRSWCPALYSKKLAVPRDAKSASEQSVRRVSPQKVIEAFLQKQQASNEHTNQESFSKCSANPSSSNINDSEGVKNIDLKALTSTTECKENPSFDEQVTSSECPGASNDKDEGHDPSGALRSSFKRYLEKNYEDEWLVNEKSSEQLLPAGKGRIFNGEIPFLEENLDQWLSAKDKHHLVSDWLYIP